ncbi:hypothetical protein V5799_026415 [Amblyomma americanum]|uniref:Nuclease HARBI1 n=1 Tax=Amblyomma americanum TaxID=6943 RepID=A0AAQ4DIM9_AMBAM
MSSEEVAALAALTDSVDRSETVDCSEDDDGDECVVLVLAAHVERQDRHRVPLYVERVVPTYLEFEFRKLFRISRSLCADITGEFEASAFYPEGCRGRRQVSAHKTMLIALTYIGTQTTMYQIADKFDVSESTVHAAISRILDFLFSISKREICWPDPDERQRSKAAFCQIGRRGQVLPDVIGVIDGCHVRIARPSESEESYYNRKKFHSIILQGVCNADMVFIDVFVGFPGSAHDSRVLRESFLFKDGESKCEGGYLSGNAAYPLLPWLLPPYRQSTTNWQPWMTAFNNAHSRQRVVVEGSFGLLKARFQRLLYIDVARISQAVHIVLAACVLHKARRRGDAMEMLEEVDSGTNVSPTEPADDDEECAVSAGTLRDSVAQRL